MRNEIYQKVEKLFHLKLEQLSGDLQNVRHDFNRVSHELSLCEAELDQEKQECMRTTEDLKRRHESEVCIRFQLCFTKIQSRTETQTVTVTTSATI